MPTQTTVIFSLLGTVFGGVGMKLIDRFFARGEKKVDDAAKLRKELWDELNSLREEVRNMRKELDGWKEKYFLVLADNAVLRQREADHNESHAPTILLPE